MTEKLRQAQMVLPCLMSFPQKWPHAWTLLQAGGSGRRHQHQPDDTSDLGQEAASAEHPQDDTGTGYSVRPGHGAHARSQAPLDPHSFITQRLINPCSAEAASMRLRPQLQMAAQSLLAMLSKTATTPGDNSSTLLIGQRGVGKTLVMERVLSDLQARHNSEPSDPKVGVVRLTGLAHTEDVAAFKQIAHQLCGTFGRARFARGASLEENLGFLRVMLVDLARAGKVVVFVLDEFDLFGRRAKQTALYNLLDAMQAADMQAAVVGLTCRTDAIELLEKRVRSRFSHRRQLVLELTAAEAQDGQDRNAWNSAVQGALDQPELRRQLTLALDAGLSTLGDPAHGQQGRRFGTPRDLAHCALHALNASRQRGSLPAVGDLLHGVATVRGVALQQVNMIASLAVLELYVLVALFRIKRQGKDSCTFETVYAEYKKLAAYEPQDMHGKTAALRALQRLLAAALVDWVDARAEQKGGQQQYQPVAVNVSLDEIDAGLKLHRTAPELLKKGLVMEAARGAYAQEG
eukprot:jgi/Astpho2/8225/fgenesh1_pg.00122_%23_9_t